MDNIFILNPSLDKMDLVDAINERITKLKALVTCLLFASYSDSGIDNNVVGNTAWAIEGFIDEIELLQEKIEKLI
jgi:hypothetical protein